MALVFAPQRGETLRLFCQLAQQSGLFVSQHQQYDPQVMDVHLKVKSMSKKQEDNETVTETFESVAVSIREITTENDQNVSH